MKGRSWNGRTKKVQWWNIKENMLMVFWRKSAGIFGENFWSITLGIIWLVRTNQKLHDNWFNMQLYQKLLLSICKLSNSIRKTRKFLNVSLWNCYRNWTSSHSATALTCCRLTFYLFLFFIKTVILSKRSSWIKSKDNVS